MYSNFGVKEKPPPAVYPETSHLTSPDAGAIVEELSYFCDYTSAHGLPHVKRVRPKAAKVTWSALCLIFFGVLIYEVTIITQKYLARDFNVLVDIKFDRKINFPAVTVCNKNAFRKTQVDAYTARYEELRHAFRGLNVTDLDRRRRRRSLRKLRKIGRKEKCALCVRTKREASGSGSGEGSEVLEEVQDYDYLEEKYWENSYDDLDFEKEDDEVEMMAYFQDVVNEMALSVKSKLSHSIKTMLLNCMFQGMPCAPGNFTAVWSYHYGNCYTFNSWTTKGASAKLKSSKSGPSQGLTLELYAEMDEYLKEMTNEVGFRVVVHDQNRIPFPHEDGFSIPTGFHTSVGVKRFEVERLGSPFSKCTPEATSDERNIYAHLVPNSYTLTVCEVSCYQMYLIQQCGCADAEYPMTAPYILNTTVSCATSNSSQKLRCEEEIWEDYTEGRLECDCLQVCKEVKYMATISQSVWPLPTEDYMEYYRKELKGRNQPSINRWLKKLREQVESSTSTTTTTMYATEIRNNVALVDVYFEDLNYERIYQTEAYTGTQMISDIGGQLGLWLGLSLLSLSEVFELIFRLVGICICNHSRGKVAMVKQSPPMKGQREFETKFGDVDVESRDTVTTDLQFT